MPFIIAEGGVNHNGQLSLALELVKAAADAGADAVKFQTFKAESLVCTHAPKANYQIKNTGIDETQFQMLKTLELTTDDFRKISEACKYFQIKFMSTPFDIDSLNFLVNDLRMEIVKIASGEITNGPFLLEIARKQKRIILSTGMSTLEDIRLALGILAHGLTKTVLPAGIRDFQLAFDSNEGQAALKEMVSLLHCVSSYPTPIDDMNLLAIQTLKSEFGLKVGLSDHSLGTLSSVIAVALGAEIIEKHFTLDSTLRGPDHKASLTVDELKEMIFSVNTTTRLLGSGIKFPTPDELETAKIVRRSLVAGQPLKMGELFTLETLGAKRPAGGISPCYFWDIVGKPAMHNFAIDEQIYYEHI